MRYKITAKKIEISWYKNDDYHRLSGPAVEWFDGYRSWYKDDQRHRLDGPAVNYINGDKKWYKDGIWFGTAYGEWNSQFLDDKEYTQEEFNKDIQVCKI